MLRHDDRKCGSFCVCLALVCLGNCTPEAEIEKGKPKLHLKGSPEQRRSCLEPVGLGIGFRNPCKSSGAPATLL